MFVLQYQGLHDLLACAGAASQGANAAAPAAEGSASTQRKHGAALIYALYCRGTNKVHKTTTVSTFTGLCTCTAWTWTWTVLLLWNSLQLPGDGVSNLNDFNVK